MNDVCAVILGGGRGTRLRPLTLGRAKPAVALAGKYRLIDVPISNCIHAGISKMFVVTQFSSVSLHRHIMQTYTFDPFRGGFIDILAAAQTDDRSDWFQGTADAVRGSLRHINYFRSQATLVLSGDHLYRMDYRQLIDGHEASGADVTLAVCPVDEAAAPSMGLLRATEAGEVRAFVEKPQDPRVRQQFLAPAELCRRAGHAADRPLYLASMGVYVFRPEVLERLLAVEERRDFAREVIPAALESHQVRAHLFNGYWRDIGTIKEFFEANISLAQPRPPMRLYEPGWPIFTHPRSLAPCRVIRSTIVDCLLAEGADVEGAEISDSVIGVRSVILPGAKLREVVMLGADYFEGDPRALELAGVRAGLPPLGVGRDCSLERVILDKNARIGDGVTIRAQPPDRVEQNDRFWIRDGITVIPSNAVISPGTVI